ncbi:MAG: SDR family oxidoreductase [Cyclobacteriaceae bacterium]
MKTVISGGLGFVGGRLSKYLVEQGHHVVAYSRQAGALPDIKCPENMHIAHPDDKDQLNGADVFIHLAALDENDCVKYPFKAIDVNITQTLDWLEHTHHAGIKKFIYFSTAHVYGKPLEGHYDENSITRPVHPYAITHKCAEDYVLAYAAEKGMTNTVIRLTNSFGGAAFPTANRWTLLVSDLSRSAVNTGKMTLLSDGMQLRDFVCLHDVCAATLHLMNLPENKITGEIFNLGGGQAVTVWDMALKVKHLAEEVLKKPIDLSRKTSSGSGKGQQLNISIEKLTNTGFALTNDTGAEIKSTLRYFMNYTA